MGRHGGHGENAPRKRGKREPEPIPDSAPHSIPHAAPDSATHTTAGFASHTVPDATLHAAPHFDILDSGAPGPGLPEESIGRRLRPEESATAAPRGGFLGSGWSASSEPSDPVWPDERRRPRGRAKLTLLAAAAVVAVLGGTVAGIQLVGSPADSATVCPPGGCVAGASNQPAPETSLTESAEESPPVEEPTPDEKAESDTDTSPVPTPTTTPRRVAPRTQGTKSTVEPTAAPTPRRTQPAQPTAEPEPTPDSTNESLVSTTRPRPLDTPGTVAPTTVPTTAPTAEPSTPVAPAGAAVKVGFGLVRDRGQAYTAQLVVTSDERLNGLTLRVPVSGEVTSVTGAGWDQVGDTLVLESPRNLGAGEDLVVTFTADGQARTPRSCQSSQGDCVVV
ncbi:hypothetical protein [Streptosporangium sp. NPDC051022]|uniref:hypothetical protein n=1 Tax=Streptosporangium sp. NPDC051022 TaxID=3155752 RepID=UPI00343847E3